MRPNVRRTAQKVTLKREMAGECRVASVGSPCAKSNCYPEGDWRVNTGQRLGEYPVAVWRL